MLAEEQERLEEEERLREEEERRIQEELEEQQRLEEEDRLREEEEQRMREEEEELRGNLFGGSQLFPHQVVDILTASPPVTQERFCTNQWSVMRKALLTRVGEGRNILPVVDMSSSMAIALGTLASEITADHLKNRMLVYGNKGDPQMLQLDPKSTICEKLRKIDQLEGCRVRSATRYSVYQMSSLPLYFRLTLEWIFQVVRDSNVPLKDVPDLVYFGNTSNGMSLYRSSFLEFQKKMAQLGESRSGVSCQPPRMYYWDISDGCGDSFRRVYQPFKTFFNEPPRPAHCCKGDSHLPQTTAMPKVAVPDAQSTAQDVEAAEGTAQEEEAAEVTLEGDTAKKPEETVKDEAQEDVVTIPVEAPQDEAQRPHADAQTYIYEHAYFYAKQFLNKQKPEQV